MRRYGLRDDRWDRINSATAWSPRSCIRRRWQARTRARPPRLCRHRIGEMDRRAVSPSSRALRWRQETLHFAQALDRSVQHTPRPLPSRAISSQPPVLFITNCGRPRSSRISFFDALIGVADIHLLPCAGHYSYDRAAEPGETMTSRRVVLLSSALLLAPGALPATAGEYWQLHRHHDRLWHTVHRSIYELENRIALLEANPEVDDAYKGQLISGARADIRRLNTKLDPPRWQWAVPCCYSRKPVRLR
jgi:hypothetical protein